MTDWLVERYEDFGWWVGNTCRDVPVKEVADRPWAVWRGRI